MTDFTISDGFQKSEIEYDQRFSMSKACYEYLFKQKWPDGFICQKCGHCKYWVSARNLYICTKCEHHHSLIAGKIIDSPKNRSPIGLKPCGGSQQENQGSML